MAAKNNPELCDICGGCVAVCPVLALEIIDGKLRVDTSKCTSCGNCVKICPVAAMSLEE